MARRLRSHEGNVVASVPWHPRLGPLLMAWYLVNPKGFLNPMNELVYLVYLGGSSQDLFQWLVIHPHFYKPYC